MIEAIKRSANYGINRLLNRLIFQSVT